jgi:anti-sigma B factor antagonist
VNRGAMPFPQILKVSRNDTRSPALITLTGEIDMTSAPLLRASLRQCLRDGIRSIRVDLTYVTFCDCSGLNAFLDAAQNTAAAGGTLRLHDPPAMLARLLDLTGSGFLLAAPLPRRLPQVPVASTCAVPVGAL